jgi:2-polyprenyl-3-methyl-5-hydroxy-6-metoxy-1,4-benzoquinol methylase
LTPIEEEQQRQDYRKGEEYAAESRRFGILAAKHLFRAQWKYTEPEWYDHRLHFLDPERHQTDFWTMSADNVIRVLPLHGQLLDLCSGDGFYDYWFYRLRAEVTCIERNPGAHAFAVKHHSHARIKYILADVLEYQPEATRFDVVLIRGAIEHFSKENQAAIIRSAHGALKPGGYFCGDTPAKQGKAKLLGAHEYEWGGEVEMIAMLSANFSDIETWSLESETELHPGDIGRRTTLFWRCRKT